MCEGKVFFGGRYRKFVHSDCIRVEDSAGIKIRFGGGFSRTFGQEQVRYLIALSASSSICLPMLTLASSEASGRPRAETMLPDRGLSILFILRVPSKDSATPDRPFSSALFDGEVSEDPDGALPPKKPFNAILGGESFEG